MCFYHNKLISIKHILILTSNREQMKKRNQNVTRSKIIIMRKVQTNVFLNVHEIFSLNGCNAMHQKFISAHLNGIKLKSSILD